MPIHKQFALFTLYVLGFTFIFNFSFKLFKERLRESKILLFLPLLYLLYFFQSFRDGVFYEIEQKLSFVVFPLLFLGSNIDWLKIKNKAFNVYAVGCLVALLVCFVVAVQGYIETNIIDAFFYTNLSIFMHAGYFSFHLCLGVSMLLYFLLFGEGSSATRKVLLALAVSFLVVGIILLSSKAPLIALILIFTFYLFKYVRDTKKWKLVVVIAGVFILALFIAYKTLDYFTYRVDSFISSLKENPKDADTTSSREMVWQRALELIKDRPLTGYGNAANQELSYSYFRNDMLVEYDHQLNAHSEFLQIFLELGIAGFSILILILIFSIIQAFKAKDMLWIAFMICVFVGFATESYLETEAGILYFCFFYCFFTISKKSTND